MVNLSRIFLTKYEGEHEINLRFNTRRKIVEVILLNFR